MVSGIVRLEDCVLADNEALSGPAVYNAVTVILESTDVCDNQLLCDDSSFLDWNPVSSSKCYCIQQGRGERVMLVLVLMPSGPC